MADYRKMLSELQTWIDLDMAHDIVDLPGARAEYQPFVKMAKLANADDIPQWVLEHLKSKVVQKIEMIKKPGKKPGSTKSGGRVKGTPNKRSMAFGTVLDESGFSIPDKAIELFNTTDDNHLKFKILEFMASYSKPKIKEIQVEDEPEQSQDSEPVDVLKIIK